MIEERREMLRWLWAKITPKAMYTDISDEDKAIYNQFKQILELAPDNLTYTVEHLKEDLPSFGHKFTPVFVKLEEHLLGITGVDVDDLDNLFDGTSGAGPVILLKTELL